MGDVDILSINSEILGTFESNTTKLSEFEEKLDRFQRTLALSDLSYRIRTNLYKNWQELKNFVDDIITKSSYNFYIMETTELLDKYKKLLKNPIKTTFMGKKDINNSEKEQLVNIYLKIAKKYQENLSVLTPKNFTQNKINCGNCQNKKNFEMIDDNNYVCLDCGNMIEMLVHFSSYKDVERVNMSTKYTYDRKVHFRDCINQYQGKQNSTIDQKVYDDLIEQFDLHSLLCEDERTRFKNITKEYIYLFLKETGHSKHYEDVILIHYNLTGKKPDDISHLEQQLLDDFDILTALYDKKFKKNKKIDRKNFINTQYVLFQLLRRHKYQCKKEDFNILKTVDRKSFHDDICKDLFEHLGWNFTSLF